MQCTANKKQQCHLQRIKHVTPARRNHAKRVKQHKNKEELEEKHQRNCNKKFVYKFIRTGWQYIYDVWEQSCVPILSYSREDEIAVHYMLFLFGERCGFVDISGHNLQAVEQGEMLNKCKK